MGQKVNPVGFRLVVNKDWNSKWFSDKDYAELLKEDFQIQNYAKKKLKKASVSKIEIERASKKTKINIHSAKPGIIIGRKGDEIEKIKKELNARFKKEITINIKEIKRPEVDAQLIAENIANQLERRVAFRRAMRKALSSAMRMNIEGCKIMIAGRLNGAEMARTEWAREGRVRLHTLRANIDYGFAEALTTYGITGIKVWVYKGEDFGKNQAQRSRKKR
jgi:small subunit ribosomal protein S3